MTTTRSRTLRFPIVGTLWAAIVGLVALTGVAFWPRWQECRRVQELESLLGDADRDKREQAVLALGEMGPAAVDAAPALLLKLAPGSGCNQSAVVDALVKIGPTAVPAILDALEHDDWHIRRRALLCLARMGPDARQAAPALIALVEGEDRELARYSVYALGRIGPAARNAVPVLRRAEGDSRPEMRAAVRLALERIESPSVAGTVVAERTARTQ